MVDQIQIKNQTVELVSHLKGRLKLLVICISNAWGGLEQVAASDALAVEKLGLEVQVLCINESPIHEYLLQKGSEIALPITFRPRDLLDLKLRSLFHELFEEGVNLIHCHQPSLIGSIVPWVWGYPGVGVVFSRHILNDHDKTDLYHRLLYNRVDSLMVMSETLRRNVLRTHPLRDWQARVVQLGLDFGRFDPKKVSGQKWRKLCNADDDTVLIGVVGRLDPAKGQATFIKACAGLMKSMSGESGKKIQFAIVGEETRDTNEKYLEQLKSMVKEFRLEEYFHFLGYQENIPEIMAALDIFVMPSRHETFGLVAIEAMALETAVVISKGGSAEEIVGEAEEWGYLVRPDSPFDLMTKLKYLVENEGMRGQVGARARQHVLEFYDLNQRNYKTLRVFERSLKRRGILNAEKA